MWTKVECKYIATQQMLPAQEWVEMEESEEHLKCDTS
jgi:hypothetical protein